MSIYIIKNKGKGLIENLTGEDLLEIKPNQSSDGNPSTGGDFIPLSGTEEGKPVTGNIHFKIDDNYLEARGFTSKSSNNNNYPNVHSSIFFSPDGEILLNRYDAINHRLSILNFDAEGRILINSMEDGNPIPSLTSDFYCGDIASTNDFIQKKYVDDAISYSTEEIKTGGTWIDGKPIYTITQLTTDAPPSDMETEFPTEIIGDYTRYKYTKTTDSPA